MENVILLEIDIVAPNAATNMRFHYDEKRLPLRKETKTVNGCKQSSWANGRVSVIRIWIICLLEWFYSFQHCGNKFFELN